MFMAKGRPISGFLNPPKGEVVLISLAQGRHAAYWVTWQVCLPVSHEAALNGRTTVSPFFNRTEHLIHLISISFTSWSPPPTCDFILDTSNRGLVGCAGCSPDHERRLLLPSPRWWIFLRGRRTCRKSHRRHVGLPSGIPPYGSGAVLAVRCADSRAFDRLLALSRVFTPLAARPTLLSHFSALTQGSTAIPTKVHPTASRW